MIYYMRDFDKKKKKQKASHAQIKPTKFIYKSTLKLLHFFYFVIAGDGEDNSGGNAASLRAARRKTDLMPTIPSPRDGGTNSRPTSGSRSLARTPGRAYSMARLDVLSQPRIVVHANNHFSQTLSGSSKSMSRSTNHLVESRRFQSNSIMKTDTSKSMIQLQSKGSSNNFIQPRMTRAQRLRNKARAAAASSKSLSPTDGHLSPGSERTFKKKKNAWWKLAIGDGDGDTVIFFLRSTKFALCG